MHVYERNCTKKYTSLPLRNIISVHSNKGNRNLILDFCYTDSDCQFGIGSNMMKVIANFDQTTNIVTLTS